MEERRMKKTLPIGNDSFAKIRGNNYYFVDKSLIIKDFIEMQEEVALIARPRGFGKTLNMTMIAEFFDISRDNQVTDFQGTVDLTRVLYDEYGIRPLVLIDEYDQPVMCSYEYGYHETTAPFFSVFYGSTMKGNDVLGQALLTGVQRVAKESIFSQFNNPKVYTVASKTYAPFFVLTRAGTEALLADYGLKLNAEVRRQYDGYRIGGLDIYNPWSILNYADTGFLDNYWVNTSSNYLVRQGPGQAGKSFWNSFDLLATSQEETVWMTLDTSYVERSSDYSLWGLLINAGYLTMKERMHANSATVKIPNGEVMAEFRTLVSELSGINNLDLDRIQECYRRKESFM